jgi:hypothetical protein
MIQPGSKLLSQIGSTTVGVLTQDYLLEIVSLPSGRMDVAFLMILQAASFAQSIMIGMTRGMYAVILRSLIHSYSHLGYVPISEMQLRATTTLVVSSFVVCTWARMETIWIRRRGF